MTSINALTLQQEKTLTNEGLRPRAVRLCPIQSVGLVSKLVLLDVHGRKSLGRKSLSRTRGICPYYTSHIWPNIEILEYGPGQAACLVLNADSGFVRSVTEGAQADIVSFLALIED